MFVSQEAIAESLLWDEDNNFKKCLSTNSVFLNCLLVPTNSAPNNSVENIYLWLVSDGREQSVFWRISGSGEQMLSSRVGHELDLEQEVLGLAGRGAAAGLWTWLHPACSNRNGAQLFISPLLCRCWHTERHCHKRWFADRASDEVKHRKGTSTPSFTLSPLLCWYLRSQLEVLWASVDGRGSFWSVEEEDFSIIKLVIPTDDNFQLWQKTWGKALNTKRELKCFQHLVGKLIWCWIQMVKYHVFFDAVPHRGDLRSFIPEKTAVDAAQI